MFWIIAGIVIVVAVALAWWSSGRSTKRLPAGNPDGDRKSQEGKAMHQIRNSGQFPGGPAG
jgi:hypothetical protein